VAAGIDALAPGALLAGGCVGAQAATVANIAQMSTGHDFT
jgi:hypothetical protein